MAGVAAHECIPGAAGSERPWGPLRAEGLLLSKEFSGRVGEATAARRDFFFFTFIHMYIYNFQDFFFKCGI